MAKPMPTLTPKRATPAATMPDDRPPARGSAWFSLFAGAAGLLLLGWLVLTDLQLRGGALVPHGIAPDALPEPQGLRQHSARLAAVYANAIGWLGVLAVWHGLLGLTRDGSPISRRPQLFALIVLTSVPIWCGFDLLNFLLLDAWRYHGLPEAWWARIPGYVIAFGCISPGMFLAGEWLARVLVGRLPTLSAFWAKRVTWLGVAGVPAVILAVLLPMVLAKDGEVGGLKMAGATLIAIAGPALASYRVNGSALAVSFALGVSLTGWAVLVHEPIAVMTLWVGLFYLVDPMVAKLGGPSLIRDWQAGRWQRTLALMAGGGVCGLCWEGLNYYAIAKWTYHLPFLGGHESVRLFEMPAWGFLGFLPFAIECWALLQLVLSGLRKLGYRLCAAAPENNIL